MRNRRRECIKALLNAPAEERPALLRKATGLASDSPDGQRFLRAVALSVAVSEGVGGLRQAFWDLGAAYTQGGDDTRAGVAYGAALQCGARNG